MVNTESPIEKVRRPPILIPKEHDYAPAHTHSESTTPLDNGSLHSHSDSDTTATNSSDEFDWDEDEDSKTRSETIKARRGRALWVAFMKLSRPIRVLLLGALVAAILITPLIVFELRFKSSPASPQVHVWSLWLTIVWASACITYLVVDAIPYIVISVTLLFGGQVERLKSQLEVRLHLMYHRPYLRPYSWLWPCPGG